MSENNVFSIELRQGKRVYGRYNEQGELEVLHENVWISLFQYVNDIYYN